MLDGASRDGLSATSTRPPRKPTEFASWEAPTETPTLLHPDPLDPSVAGGDILALVADSVICTDEKGAILVFNRAAEQAFGYRASEVIGQHVEMLLPEAFRSEHCKQVRLFASGEGATDRLMGHSREVWGRRKNGEEFPAEATLSRHIVAGRGILTVVHRDISERKELEKQREYIARELDHRIRNVFSVVSSLVRLTARETLSVEEFKESLLGRLGALGRTQTALHSDATQSANLTELITAELEQYLTSGPANVAINGPLIPLNARSAQALALVVHELATNSAKYGALSAPDGRISVTSAIEGDGEERVITIEWREDASGTGKAPGKLGFGTTLINQMIAGSLRGTAVIKYEKNGLVCQMTLPFAAATHS